MNTHIESKNRVPKFLKIAGYIISGIALAVFMAFIFGYFVMLLWNWLMPEIFGLGLINYWQAFGLIVLARILVGFHGHGHNRDCSDNNHFKNKFRKGFSDHFNASKYAKWKYYDEFWKQEGESAFHEFVKRKEGEADKPNEIGESMPK